MPLPKSLFPLGNIAVTPGAYFLMEDLELSWLTFVRRHQCGDWGDVCEADKRENERSIKNGTRILSAYEVGPIKEGKKRDRLWVLTEADRSQTTILLPEEY